MALQDLTLAEMVEITSYWITPPGTLPSGEPIPTVRLILEKDYFLKGMIPKMATLQQEMLTFQKKEVPPHPQVVAINKEQETVDDRHDTINRFLYTFPGILAEVLGDTPFTRALLALRDEMYPLRLGVNKLNYDRQSGAARLVEGRLDDQAKALLDSVSITADGQSFTLLQLTEERIEKAKRLVALDELKEKLEKEGALVDDSNGQTEHALIQKWINRVRTLERLVAMSEDLSEEEKEEVLKKRYEMEEAAIARRKAKAAAAGAPASPTEPKTGNAD